MSYTNLCKQTLGKAEAKYICRVNSGEYMVNHVENVKLKQKTKKKHKSDASFKMCSLYRQLYNDFAFPFSFLLVIFYKLPPPLPVVLWTCIQYMHLTLKGDLYRTTKIELGMKV